MNYGIIGGIIILVIIAIIVAVQLRKSSNKESASKFLDSLEDKIAEIILSTIKEAKPGKYHSLEDFETEVLSNIYDKGWDFVSNEVQNSSDVDNITKAILKYIDKDTVIKFINAIIEKAGTKDTIANVYGAYSIENSKVESEDKKLEAEYSDQSQYVEESKNEELPVAAPEIHTEEEIANLKPERDEEESFDVEDDSMEIVTDKKEIISAVSKSGQTLYYEIDANGKKKRVSKEYALQNM